MGYKKDELQSTTMMPGAPPPLSYEAAMSQFNNYAVSRMGYKEDGLQSETIMPGPPPSLSFSEYDVGMSRFKDSFVKYGLEHSLGMHENQSPAGGIKSTFVPTEHQHNGKEGQNVGLSVGKDWKRRNSYFKGYFSPDSFGSYEEVVAALKKPVSSYSLIFEHPSVQKSFARQEKKSDVQNKYAIVKVKPKKPKTFSGKALAKNRNKFPNNVRHLTMTGMFDGVPVRYILASQEKLSGVIKGGDYLCGCESCKYSKTFNASEFEHHAGCKTSHPNNHIHFQNGKTIHEIVKELKSTPEDKLADVILTVTGSPINQSAFRAWKESFQAASPKSQQI